MLPKAATNDVMQICNDPRYPWNKGMVKVYHARKNKLKIWPNHENKISSRFKVFKLEIDERVVQTLRKKKLKATNDHLRLDAYWLSQHLMTLN